MSGEPLSVQVEFDRAAAPVTGFVRADADELPFAGWADLFALLRAVVASDPSRLTDFRTSPTGEWDR